MELKGNKKFTKNTVKKGKSIQLKLNKFEKRKLMENKENTKVCMIYKICEESLNSYIRLFGSDFAKSNKSKCAIIICGKEYGMKDKICFEEYEKYGINKNVDILEVILKGEAIEEISDMFCGCENLIKVDFVSFNTKNIVDMSSMFCGWSNLTKVDLSIFITENVTNMSYMFSGCESLIKINLLSFNSDNVVDMSNMFSGCESLTEADLSSFNTQNVIDMSNMFSYCYRLIKVNLSLFNTQNITNMSWMFYGCQCLIEINRKNCSKIINDFKSIKSKLFIIEI